jgi:hypothetical protein
MLLATRRQPTVKRHLPRSEDGPGARREAQLRAELMQANSRLVALEREQRLQFERIAQIQAELDEIKALLKKLVR